MSKRLLLQPDLVLGGIITDLTPEILQANQIEGLILDVDETLVRDNHQEEETSVFLFQIYRSVVCFNL